MKERQLSFAGGEFAPTLWGRTDLQQYATGARTLRNFIVDPGGPIHNRPGTQFLHKEVDLSGAALFPFIFAADDALVLAFLDQRVLLLKAPSSSEMQAFDHAGNVNPNLWLVRNADGSLVSIASPYAEADLPRLKMAQIGNVLTIVHPSHEPRELRRLTTDSRSWSMEVLDFDAATFPQYGGVPRVKVSDNDVPLDELFDRIGDGDAQHPARPWSWAITRILEDSDGRLYETKPYTVNKQKFLRFSKWKAGNAYFASAGWGSSLPSSTVIVDGESARFYRSIQNHVADASNKPSGTGNAYWDDGTYVDFPDGAIDYADLPEDVVVYPDRPVTIDWEMFTQIPTTYSTPGAGDHRIVATRVYRGQEGRFGFLGETTESFFVDEGGLPDLSNPPPSGKNPFKVYDSDGNLLRTEEPHTVTFFQNRRYFGGTDERPSMVWGSAVDDYSNFDEIIPADEADALSFEIASKRLESVQALIARRQLLVMSASSEWAVSGSSGELVTPTSIAARPMSQHGCSTIEPLEVQGALLYLSFKGTIPWAAIFSNEGGGYQAVNISRASRHLFNGHTIKSWAYAEDPYSVVWCVRDDGVLLSLSFSMQEQMMAWARHDLAGGLALSVAAIPEGTEDAVYLAVQRGDDVCFERLATRQVLDVRDGVFLDSSVSKGLPTHGMMAKVEAGTVAVDEEVTIGHYSAAGVRNWPTGPTPWATGDTIQVEGLGRFQVITAAYDTTAVLVEVAEGATPTAPAIYGKCFTSVGGLDHLEGQEVTVLADGAVVGPLTVVAGSVDLGVAAAIANVGLQYDAEFYSLDMVGDKTRKKSARSALVETEGSRGGEVGADPDSRMTPFLSRQVQHGYSTIPLLREQHELTVGDKWEEAGTVYVRQSDPLPLTILGVTRDVVLGG